MTAPHADNRAVAERLREAAALLKAQDASPYRSNAYRAAADAVERCPRDVGAIFAAEGVRGLDAIPKVGLGIASAIAEMVTHGRWSQLDRLRGGADAVALLQTVPGIGERLAREIHARLKVDTLEDLEVAAAEGRLAVLPAVGARRASAIRAVVAEMLGRVQSSCFASREPHAEPDAAVLLDVDREYRERAARRPILHTTRGPWHFTALFSNTALAHRLGRIHDWVVVYFYDADHVERSRTVVTEHRGSLAGRRVVRGREDECRSPLPRSPHAIDPDHASQPAPLDRPARSDPPAARAP
jgi:DNA polymerase (family 10)